ncbi:ATP-binding protein [Streptomyces sp. NPDC059922]|uniref:ATP-binding protein n=1 Tax=Streptomyces sp. NPDC059922 TaxID=3347005 RepID=UPI003655742F
MTVTPSPPRHLPALAHEAARTMTLKGTPPVAPASPLEPPPRLILASDPESAAAARTYAREFVTYYVPDASEDQITDVQLITSELVTNSIRYGTEPDDSLLLVLDARPGRVRIEVHDPVQRQPQVRPESDERDGGRGLFIVDAIADRWGVTDQPFGKAVWAEVTT